MAAFKLTIVCIVLAQGLCRDLAAPPAFANAFGNGAAGKGCRYEFTVPDKVGMCSSGNAALESKMDQLKSDLDNTRLQYVSQHTVVQDQLSKVQNNVNNYGSQVNDLYNQLRQLESQLSNVPNGRSGNDLKNLVDQTKDSFHKALHDIDNKLFNMTMHMQQDAIEQSKVNAGIELQVRLQDEKARNLEEKLKDVLAMISGLSGSPTSSTSPTNPTVSSPPAQANPAMLKQVSDRLEQFDKQIQMYDKLAQQQYSAITSKTDEIALKVSNQTHQLSNIGLKSEVAFTRVQKAEQDIQKLSLDVNDFIQKDEPKIKTLEADMKAVKSDTSDLQSQISKVASKAMNADVHSLEGASSISDLKVRIQLLTMNVNSIQNQLRNQSQDIDHLSSDLQSISNNMDPSQLQKMKDALDSLKNTGVLSSVTQAQLQQVENEIHKLDTIVNGLQKGEAATTSAPTETDKPTEPTFKVPQIKTDTPTVKAPAAQTKPFVAPTLKVPEGTTVFKTPTLKVPSLKKTTAFLVPTFKAPSAQTTKPVFKVPTPPAQSQNLGPVVIKVPTPPPAFKAPTPPADERK